jgi:hypothetical protein
MSNIEEVWGNFFKSEIKSSGLKLFAQEKVSVPSGSDTLIQAYVKASPPIRVRLSSTDIGSTSIEADCSCPVARKNQFCKHVWATLLFVERKYPDFLSAKRNIEKPGKPEDAPSASSKSSYQETAKARASEYRKAQYQKQKLRAKELKRGSTGAKGGKGGKDTPGGATGWNLGVLPQEVQGALAYFTDNGFPMPEGPSEAVLGEAKRKLSRVFHPDKGGSNEEVVELNRNCDLLMRFMRG